VNVPSDDSVVNVIDRKTGELTKWTLNGAQANYPMALDEEDHRLFVVTRRPPLVVVLDTDNGKEVARVPVGASCDDVYYDAERKRIYALAGEGFISVVQQKDANHYSLSANIPSTVGVRTGIFFGTNLYVGVPAEGLEPAQIWNYGVPD
jgi:DNA-binding beta-propeller fold protein YncE